MSIQSDNMIFYYMSRENLCFLCLTEESYPKRLAFLYLEEVADALLQEMVREYGNSVRSCLCLYLHSCALPVGAQSVHRSHLRAHHITLPLYSGEPMWIRRHDPFSLFITIQLFNESSVNSETIANKTRA